MSTDANSPDEESEQNTTDWEDLSESRQETIDAILEKLAETSCEDVLNDDQQSNTEYSFRQSVAEEVPYSTSTVTRTIESYPHVIQDRGVERDLDYQDGCDPRMLFLGHLVSDLTQVDKQRPPSDEGNTNQSDGVESENGTIDGNKATNEMNTREGNRNSTHHRTVRFYHVVPNDVYLKSGLAIVFLFILLETVHTVVVAIRNQIRKG